MTWTVGPTNSLVDVAGVRVGHYTRTDDGWLTGTTVVRLPVDGAVAGVDVRGGGPGTRETDLLDHATSSNASMPSVCPAARPLGSPRPTE